jgi:hypothetical protein
MLVLLILAIVWAAILGPSLLRRRSERSADSIGDFHRQLRVLERTGPVTVDPAHRLGAWDPNRNPFRVSGARGGVLVVRPDAAAAPTVEPARSARRSDPYFRPQACRRRRHILAGLLGALVVSGLLGAIPALRPMLVVTVASAALVGVYVVLLVYLRTLAVEREVKLRYLPAPAEEASTTAGRVAAR